MMFYSDTKLINNLQVLYIRKEYTYLSGGGYPNKLATLSNHIYKSDRSTQQPQRQKNQIQNNKQLTLTLCCKCLSSLACLECKMPKFQSVGMKEGGGPLPLAFQYLIILVSRPCDLNLVMISSLASKCQHFKHEGLQFHYMKWLKNGHSNFLKPVKIS